MKRTLTFILVFFVTSSAYCQQNSGDSSLIKRLLNASNILLIKSKVEVEYYSRTEVCVVYREGIYVVAHLIQRSSTDNEYIDTTIALSAMQQSVIDKFGASIRAQKFEGPDFRIGGTSGTYYYEIGEHRKTYTDDRDRSLIKELLK